MPGPVEARTVAYVKRHTYRRNQVSADLAGAALALAKVADQTPDGDGWLRQCLRHALSSLRWCHDPPTRVDELRRDVAVSYARKIAGG
jgi:hypothetical protein